MTYKNLKLFFKRNIMDLTAIIILTSIVFIPDPTNDIVKKSLQYDDFERNEYLLHNISIDQVIIAETLQDSKKGIIEYMMSRTKKPSRPTKYFDENEMKLLLETPLMDIVKNYSVPSNKLSVFHKLPYVSFFDSFLDFFKNPQEIREKRIKEFRHMSLGEILNDKRAASSDITLGEIILLK